MRQKMERNETYKNAVIEATKEENLRKDIQLTLAQRVKKLNIAMPRLGFSVYRLRKVYVKARIRQRKFKSKLQLSPK